MLTYLLSSFNWTNERIILRRCRETVSINYLKNDVWNWLYKNKRAERKINILKYFAFADFKTQS